MPYDKFVKQQLTDGDISLKRDTVVNTRKTPIKSVTSQKPSSTKYKH